MRENCCELNKLNLGLFFSSNLILHSFACLLNKAEVTLKKEKQFRF